MLFRPNVLLLLPTLAAVVLPTAVVLGNAGTAVAAASTSTVRTLVPSAEPKPVHPAARPTALAVRTTVAAPVRKAAATHPVRHVTKPAHRVAPRTTAAPVVRHTTAPAPAPKPAVKPAPTRTSVRGDDYPYAHASGTDPWGFTERQCVSFAAWRLSQHGHALDNGSQNWGSALTWDDTARRLGDRVSSSPTVGSIAQWNANESSPYYGSGAKTPNGSFVAGGYGHVAYVAAVYSDGSVLVEQYNMGDSQAYSTMHVKAPRYLSIS